MICAHMLEVLAGYYIYSCYLESPARLCSRVRVLWIHAKRKLFQGCWNQGVPRTRSLNWEVIRLSRDRTRHRGSQCKSIWPGLGEWFWPCEEICLSIQVRRLVALGYGEKGTEGIVVRLLDTGVEHDLAKVGIVNWMDRQVCGTKGLVRRRGLRAH
jgi:hypothetical protein